MIKGLLVGFLVFMCGRIVSAQIVINPQVGMNASTLSTGPEGVDAGARLGYHLGGYLRLGGRVYLQPGFFVVRVGTQLRSNGDVNYFDISEFTEKVDVGALHFPLLLGLNLFKRGGSGLRIHAGLGATFITDVRDNELGLDEEDIDGFLIGARGGLGVDAGFLTIDLDFERGLTDMFAEEFLPASDLSIRNDVLRVSVGLKFP